MELDNIVVFFIFSFFLEDFRSYLFMITSNFHIFLFFILVLSVNNKIETKVYLQKKKKMKLK